MLGLVVQGIQVENIATTQKTLPDFPGAWLDLLSQVNTSQVTLGK